MRLIYPGYVLHQCRVRSLAIEDNNIRTFYFCNISTPLTDKFENFNRLFRADDMRQHILRELEIKGNWISCTRVGKKLKVKKPLFIPSLSSHEITSVLVTQDELMEIVKSTRPRMIRITVAGQKDGTRWIEAGSEEYLALFESIEDKEKLLQAQLDWAAFYDKQEKDGKIFFNRSYLICSAHIHQNSTLSPN